MACPKALNKATLAPGTSTLFSFASWHTEPDTVVCLTHPSPFHWPHLATSPRLSQPPLIQKEGTEPSMLPLARSSTTWQQSNPPSACSQLRERNPSGTDIYKGLHGYSFRKCSSEPLKCRKSCMNSHLGKAVRDVSFQSEVPAPLPHFLNNSKPSIHVS